mmetsp:Transcript_3011/g.7475  ORF Transcript_3011/g.7475 Transcript_3011/m.7475 type:complete len:205 (-) Transcript_3011:180-794(-)
MVHLDLYAVPASLRMAWLMRRAWPPTCGAPTSPSSSARGTSALTLSTTTRPTTPLRASSSTVSSACSPLSGWQMSRLRMSTPRPAAYLGSNACSASTMHAMDPDFCISAIACSASVVLPLDSGPNTSTTRPLGMPPPSAASRGRQPLGNVSMATEGLSPSFMMEPLPYLSWMLAIVWSSSSSRFLMASSSGPGEDFAAFAFLLA